MDRKSIEVYEWNAGEPRPGAAAKQGMTLLDTLQSPPDGQLPQKGDVLLLNDPVGDPGRVHPAAYRVVSREILYFRGTEHGDKHSPAEFRKMWIHVRKLGEDEYKNLE